MDQYTHKDIIIIGAGIGGLTAAYELAGKTDQSVQILEKSEAIGNVLRGIQFEDFTVDVGFKRLYSRIPEVEDFYFEVLGDDFMRYDQRIGVLFNGHIYEREPRFRGVFRGLSGTILMKASADLIWNRMLGKWKKPKNLEDVIYSRKGELFSRIFSQGYHEKLKGVAWKDQPPNYRAERLPENGQYSWRHMWNRLISLEDSNRWHHPIRGCQSLVDALMKKIKSHDVGIQQGVSVNGITQMPDLSWVINTTQEGISKYWRASHLICAMPIELTNHLLNGESIGQVTGPASLRPVVLVYFFLNRPPRFPHNCLRVTDPSTAISRITNYNSFGGQMVPYGKGCIAVEIFGRVEAIGNKNPLISEVREYCVQSNLIEEDSIIHQKLISLENTEVASSWEDYRENPRKMELFESLRKRSRLYMINRTGIDKTIYAAKESVKAILTGDNTLYDLKTAPNQQCPWLNSKD